MLHMPKRKKAKIGVISRYFEGLANEAFAEQEAKNIPAYTFCFRLWDRVCVTAVLNEDCENDTIVALDGLRILTQKKFKTAVCLICRKDAKNFSWQAAEERVVELLDQFGGEAE